MHQIYYENHAAVRKITKERRGEVDFATMRKDLMLYLVNLNGKQIYLFYRLKRKAKELEIFYTLTDSSLYYLEMQKKMIHSFLFFCKHCDVP